MTRIAALTASLFLVLFCLSCEQSDNVASGTSRLFLTANPPQIAINTTSVLTVSGTDENGVPLPDGTEVSFRVTEAGRVSPSPVQLVNGSATSTYHATTFSGDIVITAVSGSVEASFTITVADDVDQKVFVSADPATLPEGGGTSIISAVVTDDSGDPLSDVGVQFSTTQGTLQSGGDLISTNENGLATDVLNTTLSATVTATTDDDFSDETNVVVSEGRIVCHLSVSTETPNVNEVVSFFDTSDVPDGQIVTYHWDFGDGASADGQNVQHAYNTEGTFTILHSVTDVRGDSTNCDPFVIEVSN